MDLVKDGETGKSKGYAFCVYQDTSVPDFACAALNGVRMGDKSLTLRRMNEGTTFLPALENESLCSLQEQQRIALQDLMLEEVRVSGQPNPNLGGVELSPGSAGVFGDADCILVDGLPCYFTEAQIRELLESFGPLRGMDLVKDGETGKSKGYAFCVYQDTSVSGIACAGLNGIRMGDKTLTVRRMNEGMTFLPTLENESLCSLQEQQRIALQELMLEPLATSKVLCLTNVVSPDELIHDDDYDDIVEDIRLECGKFGTLLNLVIPRPGPNGDVSPGVGKAFLEYADVESATKARNGLNGRKFGGTPLVVIYYSENKFSEGDYGA
ncbi:OLC1v1029597C1 [Oldenlandia corymbosa var. corymbosa]|uniref:OLC1v1029597C1 n=1 Tax=Oldenlandia corymbosa var. corymbosa TaxID=529605 RepID=A0AAV1CHC4_OLDCO|nr:OLC1v1029597C1 [Oldenlandia corymbosa var. corymbosa]